MNLHQAHWTKRAAGEYRIDSPSFYQIRSEPIVSSSSTPFASRNLHRMIDAWLLGDGQVVGCCELCTSDRHV
jgi:hypothetical protein